MPIGMTLSAKQRVPALIAGGTHSHMLAMSINCDGRQLKLADSDLGREQYRSSDYYVWSAGSDGQLLFIFPTLSRVSLTTITLTLVY